VAKLRGYVHCVWTLDVTGALHWGVLHAKASYPCSFADYFNASAATHLLRRHSSPSPACPPPGPFTDATRRRASVPLDRRPLRVPASRCPSLRASHCHPRLKRICCPPRNQQRSRFLHHAHVNTHPNAFRGRPGRYSTVLGGSSLPQPRTAALDPYDGIVYPYTAVPTSHRIDPQHLSQSK